MIAFLAIKSDANLGYGGRQGDGYMPDEKVARGLSEATATTTDLIENWKESEQSRQVAKRLCVGNIRRRLGNHGPTTGVLVAALDMVCRAPCSVHAYTDGHCVGGAVAQHDRGADRMHAQVTP